MKPEKRDPALEAALIRHFYGCDPGDLTMGEYFSLLRKFGEVSALLAPLPAPDESDRDAFHLAQIKRLSGE